MNLRKKIHCEYQKKSSKLKKDCKTSLYQRKNNLIIDLIIKELYSNFFNGNIKTIKIINSKKYKNNSGLCVSKYDKYDNSYNIIYLEQYIFDTLIESFKNENDYSNNSIYSQSLKVLLHEFFHTENEIGCSKLEEAITEINTQLIFSYFYKIINKTTYENDFDHLTYKTYISDLFNFFDYINIDDQTMFNILIDIKTFKKEENPTKYYDLSQIYDYGHFIIFLDKYYIKDLLKNYFPKLETIQEEYFNIFLTEDEFNFNEFKVLYYFSLENNFSKRKLSEDRVQEIKNKLFKYQKKLISI